MNDTPVSSRAWRSTLMILVLSIALPILLAIVIAAQGSLAAQHIVWTGFDDRWSINAGSIDADRWQVSVISNSIGIALHPIDLSAFAFEARVQTDDPQLATGLLINLQDQLNFTAFLISGDGYFSVREKRSGVWLDRVTWRTWPHVKRDGESNLLRIECRSSGCTFFVNDEVTWQANDLSARGSIGFITYPAAPNDRSALVTFDQVSVRQLIDR